MKKLNVDMVSDLMCPWCALGLQALEQALTLLGDELEVELRFRPFELNPEAPLEGIPVFDNMASKYGLAREQVLANFARITDLGLALGFTFNMEKRSHYYNSFDAHRLLHWAGEQGGQLALKKALLAGYFTDAQNLGDHQVLADIAQQAGLDRQQALAMLASDRYRQEVRQAKAKYRQLGVRSIPTLVINDQYQIVGSQSPADYVQLLRELANKLA
ncbi:DsbA family oxidoreductase [Gallaecimonas xiamenensis]|uniref:DSBA oxidoreductase n=1 Tax=Gallaecimonas xiamenensis 3-C-1 TaxID=745411 RepID=K2JN65_9GAMM|nr:DsbA family oxidoreductase [Gallaecimonas xiamenensis]EKE75937.1 DSBA oxidoreductase [Gallaecimonas xiamenensis 3-C-1]